MKIVSTRLNYGFPSSLQSNQVLGCAVQSVLCINVSARVSVEFVREEKLILKLMAIIITNLFAAIAVTTDKRLCYDHHMAVRSVQCAIANYFVRSNAIDYTVAINIIRGLAMVTYMREVHSIQDRSVQAPHDDDDDYGAGTWELDGGGTVKRFDYLSLATCECCWPPSVGGGRAINPSSRLYSFNPNSMLHCSLRQGSAVQWFPKE